MYKRNNLISILDKDLKREIETIQFYMQNLDKLNYRKNKKKIDVLIFDSFSHASWIAEEILLLKKDSGKKLDGKTQKLAMAEEIGLQELYKYELNRTNEKSAKEILSKLIAEEKKHERVVKALR